LLSLLRKSKAFRALPGRSKAAEWKKEGTEGLFYRKDTENKESGFENQEFRNSVDIRHFDQMAKMQRREQK
jgi:hypothetical protein